MEEKLDEIIKLLKGIDEKLEVLVNQKVPKSNNSNKAILLKQYEETEKQLQDINAKIAEYKEKGVNDQETEQLLEQELKEANLLLRKNRSSWRRSNSNSI